MEARGGVLAQQTAVTFSITAMMVSYASMRAKGFRTFPLTTTKVPKVAALALWGVLGFEFGINYVY
jgi:hypothetical protein